MAKIKSQRQISADYRKRREAQSEHQVQIWLTEALKTKVDEAVKAKGLKSRSELISQLLEGNLESAM